MNPEGKIVEIDLFRQQAMARAAGCYCPECGEYLLGSGYSAVQFTLPPL